MRGVASNGATSFAAITTDATTTIEARAGAQIQWHVTLDGRGGPLAVTDDGAVIATLSGTGHVGTRPVRGEPSAAVAALDAATGATRWLVPFEASEWSVINGIAAASDGLIVGGAFSGSLRIGTSVVTSAGKSDGFVAKLGRTGEVAWLVRFGGINADAIQGVAARGTRVAIAGTYAATAELLGTPLPAFDEKTPFTDDFVAVLDGRTGVRTWIATFGGKANDSVAGVAIDDEERVIVAATARETIHIGGSDLVVRGATDGLVASWAPDATFLHAVLLGGDEVDGLTGIVAVGDHLVVAGYYAGSIRLDRDLTAGGGDDAFLAAIDYGGSVLSSWPIHGDGREEITALASTPGGTGLLAGLAHTGAVTLDDDTLPAPATPTSGFALLAR